MKKNISIIFIFVLILTCFSASISAVTYHCDEHPQYFIYKQHKTESTLHERWCTKHGGEYFWDTEPHTFNLRANLLGHWQECEYCGYMKDEDTHAFTQESDGEYHWHICEECGYSTSQEAHLFRWQSNNFYHWKECTECGYTTAQELHTIDGNGGCSVCSRSNEIMKIIPPVEVIPVAK